MTLSTYNGDEQQFRFTHSHSTHGSPESNPITHTAQTTTTRLNLNRGAESDRNRAPLDDDELSLYPPFANAWESSPQSDALQFDDARPPLRYYYNEPSLTSLLSLKQSFGTSSTSFNSLTTSNSIWACSSTAAGPTSTSCSACQRPMCGQFVRALGTVFHLDCFTCLDCNAITVSRFFPVEGPDGKQHPLCERDYFKRLDLICFKCDQALRGYYITACNKKFHIEHFTCSVCPTLFGQQDPYFEHDGAAYCRFHYSTRFATKCCGCDRAILKQFVQVGRNMVQECWHRECYMIHKFWNVKVAVLPTRNLQSSESAAYVQEEAEYNSITLKERQTDLEALVYRIWTQLSAFEESAAACVSDTIRHVGDEMYIDAIRAAEKFVLHVEVLFAVIDELEAGFTAAAVGGIAHVREARMLCSKIVAMFNVMSRPKDPPPASSTSQVQHQAKGTDQELKLLVTSLSHYTKVLIRNSLTGALSLERDHANKEAVPKFLDRFLSLKMDCARLKDLEWLQFAPVGTTSIGASSSEPAASLPPNIIRFSGSTTFSYSKDFPYGYRSLRLEGVGEPFFGPKAIARGGQKGCPSGSTPSVACIACQSTIDENCVRLGAYHRWHSHCIKCITCGKAATLAPSIPEATADGSALRSPLNVHDFRYDQLPAELGSSSETKSLPEVAIYCTSHAPLGCPGGFSAVSRLEQYAYLLYVGVHRLDIMLQKQRDSHFIETSTPTPDASDYPPN